VLSATVAQRDRTLLRLVTGVVLLGPLPGGNARHAGLVPRGSIGQVAQTVPGLGRPAPCMMMWNASHVIGARMASLCHLNAQGQGSLGCRGRAKSAPRVRAVCTTPPGALDGNPQASIPALPASHPVQWEHTYQWGAMEQLPEIPLRDVCPAFHVVLPTSTSQPLVLEMDFQGREGFVQIARARWDTARVSSAPGMVHRTTFA
jgi:hypothetical protein